MNRPDFTYIAVSRQLKAMDAVEYELGLYDRANDKMLPRFWSSQKVLSSINFLRQKNANGHDIFIRPKGSVGLVFFDDFSRSKLSQLESDGLRPAVTIQSSPDNFHGWIRVSDKTIEPELATGIAKLIAARYGGDVHSADWRHFGRLAGFTNLKPEYRDDCGRPPFVKLHDGNGNLAIAADALIEAARMSLATKRQEEHERMARILRAQEHYRLNPGDKIDPSRYYEGQLNGIIKKYGLGFNRSDADWMIVNRMLLRGYTREEIHMALMLCSPAAEKRGKYAEKYVVITLDFALGIRERIKKKIH